MSTGFRSDDGAKDFATIRSVLSTERKQRGLLETLMGDPFSLVGQLRLVRHAAGSRAVMQVHGFRTRHVSPARPITRRGARIAT